MYVQPFGLDDRTVVDGFCRCRTSVSAKLCIDNISKAFFELREVVFVARTSIWQFDVTRYLHDSCMLVHPDISYFDAQCFHKLNAVSQEISVKRLHLYA